MKNVSIQELYDNLARLQESQQQHLACLENRLNRYQQKLKTIEVSIIGAPNDSHHEVTNYIDKHGF